MNYYKRHLGDYAKKCGHLSALEHGVYNLIIDAYYDREQAPTLADAYRWGRARSDEERAAVEAVLQEFFLLRDGRYFQNRIEEELDAYRERQDTNRKLGAKGGVAKAKRTASESLSGPPENAKRKPSLATNPLTTNTNTEPDQKKKQPPQAVAFVIPGWIDPEVWSGYLEMRKKKRAAPSVRACAMVITELIKLRDGGHEPNAVLDQSTRNSWTDVYAIKPKGTDGGNGTRSSAPSVVERIEQNIARNRAARQTREPITGELVDP